MGRIAFVQVSMLGVGFFFWMATLGFFFLWKHDAHSGSFMRGLVRVGSNVGHIAASVEQILVTEMRCLE